MSSKIKRRQTRSAFTELFQKGILAHIKRVRFNEYHVIVNFEIRKKYRQRRSCNRYIEKMNLNT